MLEVKLGNEEVFARKGAMVSYQGDVAFSRSFLAAQGVQSLAMRAVTNEGYALMSARGTGSVFYAQGGLFVSIVPVRGETFYVESDSLLAFDARLTAGTMFLGNQGGVQGVVRGMASGQGLFTTTLQARATWRFCPMAMPSACPSRRTCPCLSTRKRISATRAS